jgi:hypothetical protein
MLVEGFILSSYALVVVGVLTVMVIIADILERFL